MGRRLRGWFGLAYRVNDILVLCPELRVLQDFRGDGSEEGLGVLVLFEKVDNPVALLHHLVLLREDLLLFGQELRRGVHVVLCPALLEKGLELLSRLLHHVFRLVVQPWKSKVTREKKFDPGEASRCVGERVRRRSSSSTEQEFSLLWGRGVWGGSEAYLQFSKTSSMSDLNAATLG